MNSPTTATFTTVPITTELVEKAHRELDVGKPTDPDEISPMVLKQCTRELSTALAVKLFSCTAERKWPASWKEASVVPVHKKRV